MIPGPDLQIIRFNHFEANCTVANEHQIAGPQILEDGRLREGEPALAGGALLRSDGNLISKI